MPPLLEVFANATRAAAAAAAAAAAPAARATIAGGTIGAAPAATAALAPAINATLARAVAPVINATLAAAANATAKGAAKKAAAAAGLGAVALGWQGIVVIVTLGLSLIVMGADLVGPDLVFGALASIYMVSGIITLKEAASGFANTGVLTVLALYMVAEGVSQTGGLDIFMNKILGKASSVFWAQVRLMIPVMISSAFLNNTPIVALLIPILLSWSRRCNVPAKKLLIPLSFATVLGGTATLIGTSTNLVVSGLQAEMAKKDPTIPVFNFFTITPYGLPYAAWGMAYILIFSWLLPGHEGSGHTDLASELSVDKSSPAAGRALAASGLLQPVGTARVIGVRTAAGGTVAQPSGDTFLEAGDTVIVQGSAQDNSLFATQNGLVLLTPEEGPADGDSAEAGSVDGSSDANLVQVSVSSKADIIGSTIRDTGFRGRFGAAVIAVKRGAVKQGGRIGDVILRKGDVLVLSAGPGFDPKSEDFVKNFGKKLKRLDQAVQREFSTAMRVKPGPLVGKTITAAGLRGVTGLYLFEIHRGDEVLHAVGPDTVLQEGDLLMFAGDLASVSFLMKLDGLEHMQKGQLRKLPAHQVDRALVQAVVAPHSPLVHKTAREARLRTNFGAALLSVHRAGQPVTGDVASVRLQSGDVLVLEAGPEFASAFAHNPAFALISTVPNSAPVKKNRMWIALAIVAALVATQVVEGATGKDIVHLWPASMLAAGVMLATRCMSASQARSSLDWEVYVAIAFAFAVSNAMEKTNVALAIAELFAALSRRIGGQTAALTTTYICTSLLSELLTNNAAAAIMFPIAAELAKKLAVDMNMMSIAVMLGGSAGWILPYSYQCNLMVMAAGGYRTVDFAKFGAPFHIWLLVGVILILGSGNRVAIPLIATGVFTAVIIIVPLCYEKLLSDSQRAAIAGAFSSKKRKGGGGGGGRAAASAAFLPADAAVEVADDSATSSKAQRDQAHAARYYERQW